MSRWGTAQHWTGERIIMAIRRFHQETDRWPQTQDFGGNDGQMPHAVTVQRLYGTLAEARRQAGMPDGGGHEGHGGGGATRGGGWTIGKHRTSGTQAAGS